ncbi:Pentatricopeptide repeat-containing protein [Rhynchospora pubera]|uniref:Pentatricopeptide repeat-containing protein n=1 Tax=Rhynchospora pubera TaxID=906938 RepID=A0AAV8F0X3_9POAL|nr:Pentatricopeptide repeat-containing protein [Rhynchospora pubera]
MALQCRNFPLWPPKTSRFPHLSSESASHSSLSSTSRSISLSKTSSSITSSTPDPISHLTPKQQTIILTRLSDWRESLRTLYKFKSRPDYQPNQFHYNVVLRTLGLARKWDQLRLLWIDMAKEAVFPTNATYATLIDVFSKGGMVREALLWLKHMKSRGIVPDEVTMSTVLCALKNLGEFDMAVKYFNNWCQGRDGELDFLELDYSSVDVVNPTSFLLSELFKTGCHAPISANDKAQGDFPRKLQLVSTYNTIIDLFGKAGRLKEASDTFGAMLDAGLKPDSFTFNTMINICASNGNLDEAEQLFDKMAERGITPDVITFNVLMTMHGSMGDIKAVLSSYERIRLSGLEPDTVSHRIVLRLLCEKQMVRQVEKVINGILDSGSFVDEESVPIITKMYVDLGLIHRANKFLKKHCSGENKISSRNYAAIIDAYGEKGLWKEAEAVFYGEREIGYRRDIVEYNIMIKAYGLGKQCEKAFSLYETMKRCGVWPDECTFNTLIHMFSVCGLPGKAHYLLNRMRNNGFKPGWQIFSVLMEGYSKRGAFLEAVEVLDEMNNLGVRANEIVYGLLIDMFAELGKVDEALYYLNQMQENGLEPNKIVLTSLIKGYAKSNLLKEAQEVYSQIERIGSEDGGPDTITSNCMLNLYANLGLITEATHIFDELRRKCTADRASFTIMINLYETLNMLDKATMIFEEFCKLGLDPDVTLVNEIMVCYVAKGDIRGFVDSLKYMLDNKVFPDDMTYSHVFKALKKAGLSYEMMMQLEKSYRDGNQYVENAILASLFSVYGMHKLALDLCKSYLISDSKLDLVLYNVAIRVFGSAGHVSKAIKLFANMSDEGIEPDTVTYVNLLFCYEKSDMVAGVRRINDLVKEKDIGANESLYKALIEAYRDLGRTDLAESAESEMRFVLFSDDESGFEATKFEDPSLIYKGY